jgi:hypothetical protein
MYLGALPSNTPRGMATQVLGGGATLIGLALANPRLDSLEFLVVVGLIAAYMVPDWLSKLIAVAEELRRFRTRWRS